MLSKRLLAAARRDHAKILAKLAWHKEQADALDLQLQALDKLLEGAPAEPTTSPPTEGPSLSAPSEDPAASPAAAREMPGANSDGLTPPDFLKRGATA